MATVAVLFAMTGGAYAASRIIIKSTSQISPKVLKALKGKTGPAGPQGPEGKAGAVGQTGPQGPEGKAGGPGKDGAPGKSVVAGSETKGTNCPEGGSNFEVEGSGVKHFACNGKEGSPWTAGGTLPKGATEKGLWSVSGLPLPTTGVGFTIPLSKAPSVHYINEAGKEYTATGEQTSTVCNGTFESPTAPEGELCVYAATEANVSKEEAINEFLFGSKWGIAVSAGGPAVKFDTAQPFGFVVAAVSEKLEENVNANGSWAVTG